MREKYIVGNWKMNHKQEDISKFFEVFSKTTVGKNCHAWVAPQAIHLPFVLELSNKKCNGKLLVGGQNCCYEKSGAYTGEISPEALKDIGATFVIIGHSERRAIYKEQNSELCKKSSAALSCGLQVIFCVGETLEERESGKTEKVIEQQIIEGIKPLDKKSLQNIIIAYEPVWAIGTGKTATPSQAEDVHKFIRTLWEKEGLPNAHDLIILYGGSVKPANIGELMAQKNIDGALVGGASLKGEDFSALTIAN